MITTANAGDAIQIPFSSGYKYTQPVLKDKDNSSQETGSNALNSKNSPEIVGKKSVGLAFLMSLALPGSGEYYMGRRDHSVIFLTSEILLWSGLAANSFYADHLEGETYTYAVQHAGVSREGKDKQYWIDIGKFNSIYEFNEQRRRDRYFEAVYQDQQDKFWLWDSRDNRLRYDSKRLDANEIAGQDVYFYATIVLNHLVSAINSLRLARKHNRELAEKVDWSLRFHSYHIDNNKFYGIKISKNF
jgi:hypothetical protein